MLMNYAKTVPQWKVGDRITWETKILRKSFKYGDTDSSRYRVRMLTGVLQ